MQQSQRLEDMSPTDHFAWLIAGIRVLVGGFPSRTPALMFLIVWRLNGAQRRFNALVAKIAAGKVLAPLKPRRAPTPRTTLQTAARPSRPASPIRRWCRSPRASTGCAGAA